MSRFASEHRLAALVVVPAMVVLAGCGGATTTTETAPAERSAIELPTQDAMTTRPAPSGTAVDPVADVEVEDQSGDGTEVIVSAIAMSRGNGILVIRDAAGQVLGVADVSPATQPVTIRLDRPVTTSQELVATLYADDGDGRLERKQDQPLLDDEGEAVSEEFDYVVT